MNRFVIADPKTCIGRRTCEIACVMAHREESELHNLSRDNFTPRIHVIKGDNISTAILCRQCEDAPCANVCPNGAISRQQDFICVDQEKCIGCKTCVVACPYGTMEVVTTTVTQRYGSSGCISSSKAEANKCDLCNHRANGPACVEACPTKALKLIDRNAMQALIQERRQRAAFDNLGDLL
ncbi:electron transport protein HydN [Edwardsiella piscicida]|uniref:electron transport protein HydN n=1 Tax=Edwardsiella piscicida TaxID=1263550 RepID=UPI001CF38FC4|nr:electron transport protein HydN [Edwardsiella piscicida]UCQ57067.1 electron transport protein HydN [Edwardsiella piscicida]